MSQVPKLKIKEHMMDRWEKELRELLTSLYDFEDRVYLDGTHYLAEQPEFKDVDKISSVLKALEDKKGLLEILEENLKDDNIKVNIGTENRTAGLDECTLITANYIVEDDITGAMGILGPMRMEYEKVIPTLGRIAESISTLFNEMI